MKALTSAPRKTTGNAPFIPIIGLAAGLGCEWVSPLARSVYWFPTSIRGVVAAFFLLLGVGLILLARLSLQRARAALHVTRDTRSREAEWLLRDSGDFMFYGTSVLILGFGLAFQLYWVASFSVLAAVLTFAFPSPPR